MSDKEFVNNYLKDLSSLLEPHEEIIDKIVKVKDILTQV